MKKTCLIAAAVLAAAGLSACSSLDRVNPFHKDSGNAITASQGERIPVNISEQTLEPAEALKGVDFFLPPPVHMTEWPLPGGTPEQSVEHVDAAPAFEIAWRRGVGQSSTRHRHVTASPVAAEGRIYVMDAEARVSAHDPSSGARIWDTDLRGRDRHDRNAFGGGLAYGDGRIYVTSGYRFVAALDAKTGAVIWKTRVITPIHGAPTTSEGRVFAVDLEDELLAFDAKTGQSAWNYQALVEPARILEASSPAISGQTVVAPFASGELVALQASNGNELWTQSLSRASRTNALSEIRDIAGRPVIYKGDVLTASHSGLFANIDLRTGSIRWALPISSITSPLATGDVVYVISKDGQLLCIARESGQIYWMIELNKDVAPLKRGMFGIMPKSKVQTYWSGPILASGRLVLVSSRGEALALDPKTGAVQRSLNLGAPALMSPIAVGNMLYLVTDKANLVAIR